MSNEKCIIILSEKSSGSSACQNLLAKFADIQHVRSSRHYENETLYWTKAASILGKSQVQMVDSEVPIPAGRARLELIELLRENLGDYVPPTENEALIREGWRLLCQRYAPVFLEKSPHHLCQWSALELIAAHMQTMNDVDFLLIGLIRNPMDTIYSQYQRWKSPTAEVEQQWCIAYQNLLRLKELVGEQLVIVRYEDMISSLDYLDPVFRFCGVTATETSNGKGYLHKKSLQKWKRNYLYGFTLSEETIALAETYGYHRAELSNDTYSLWPVVQKVSRATYLATKPARKAALTLLEKNKSLLGNFAAQ